MKRYEFMVLLFALAVLFFVYGTFADREAMKISSLGLALLVFLAIGISWQEGVGYLSQKTQHIQSAIASSNAFLFLVALLGFVFLWNIFIQPIENIDFAIFGALFLSVLLMRLSIMQALGKYLGPKF